MGKIICFAACYICFLFRPRICFFLPLLCSSSPFSTLHRLECAIAYCFITQHVQQNDLKRQTTIWSLKYELPKSYKVQKPATFPKSHQEYRVKKPKPKQIHKTNKEKQPRKPKTQSKESSDSKIRNVTRSGTLLKMLRVLQWRAVIQKSFIVCFNLSEKTNKQNTLQ